MALTFNELSILHFNVSIRAGLERSNEDMRRTLTDFITSTAEISQEQNHMIEASVVRNSKI